MCFPFFGRKDKERYLLHHDNKLNVIGLIDKDFSKKENLNFSDINIWICNTDLTIIYGTYDKVNKINPNDLIGKNIYDIEPKDFAKFCGDLHKRAQDAKEPVKLNLLINEKIVYITVKPIVYLGEVIASILIIIPYKKYDRNLLAVIN